MSGTWRKRALAVFAAATLTLLGAACEAENGAPADDTLEEPAGDPGAEDPGTDDTLEEDTEGDA